MLKYINKNRKETENTFLSLFKYLMSVYRRKTKLLFYDCIQMNYLYKFKSHNE